jgi:hypothetical protein
MAMPKVGRAHQPREWDSWAITREDFATLVREFVAIMLAAPGGWTEAHCLIKVRGYERDFENADEFLENVDEQEWVGLEEINATVHLRAKDVARPMWGGVWIEGRPWDRVRLSLHDGTRMERNAVEPDLAALIDKHARSERTLAQRSVASGWPLLLLPVVLIVGASIALPAATDLSLGTRVGVLAAWGLWVSVLAGVLGYRLSARLERLVPLVEFLPAHGRSRWDDAKALIWKRARVAGAIVGGVVAVASLVVAIIALD